MMANFEESSVLQMFLSTKIYFPRQADNFPADWLNMQLGGLLCRLRLDADGKVSNPFLLLLKLLFATIIFCKRTPQMETILAFHSSGERRKTWSSAAIIYF